MLSTRRRGHNDPSAGPSKCTGRTNLATDVSGDGLAGKALAVFAWVIWPAFIGADLVLWQFGWVWALLFVVAVFGLLVRVYGTSDEMPSSYHKGASSVSDVGTTCADKPTNWTSVLPGPRQP